MTNEEVQQLYDIQEKGYMIYWNHRMVQDFIHIGKNNGGFWIGYHEDAEVDDIEDDIDMCQIAIYQEVKLSDL